MQTILRTTIPNWLEMCGNHTNFLPAFLILAPKLTFAAYAAVPKQFKPETVLPFDGIETHESSLRVLLLWMQ